MRRSFFAQAAVFAVMALLIVLWVRQMGQPIAITPSSPMPRSEFADNPELINPGLQEESYRLAEVSAGTVSSLLESYVMPADMYWSTTYSITVGEYSPILTAVFYSKEGLWRVDRFDALGRADETYIYYEDTVTIRDRKTGESSKLPFTSQYEIELLMYMPSMKTLAATDVKYIKDVRFDIFLNQKILYVECEFPETGQTEKYWISLEFGVPIVAESYINGTRYMHTTTTAIREEVQREELFE